MKTDNKQTIAYTLLTFKFQKEGNQWVGICDELGTSSFGNDIVDAENQLAEAVDLHIYQLAEAGELQRFLKEHGIKATTIKPTGTVKVPVLLDNRTFIQYHVQPLIKEKVPA